MSNYYNDDVKLGLAIGKLKEESYYYREIVKFIKGEDASSYSYFGKLKPFFDRFGYEKTMDVLLAIIAEDEQEEQKEQEEQNAAQPAVSTAANINDAEDAEEERKEGAN